MMVAVAVFVCTSLGNLCEGRIAKVSRPLDIYEKMLLLLWRCLQGARLKLFAKVPTTVTVAVFVCTSLGNLCEGRIASICVNSHKVANVSWVFDICEKVLLVLWRCLQGAWSKL
jgi:transcription elongation factor Elf1